MLRSLVILSLVAPLLLAGCGGGEDNPTPTPVTPTTTPASATFSAASAYRAYAAAARQQSFELNPFGFCAGRVSLTETAPVAAFFEGNPAMRKTVTWGYTFSNCMPGSLTRLTELFLDANNAAIGESRTNVNYVVFDRPLELPASVKVGDAGTLATASVYSDGTKTNRTATTEYSFSAEADNRADAILVNVSARTSPTFLQQTTEVRTYRLTAEGSMLNRSAREGGRGSQESHLHLWLVRGAQRRRPLQRYQYGGHVRPDAEAAHPCLCAQAFGEANFHVCARTGASRFRARLDHRRVAGRSGQ